LPDLRDEPSFEQVLGAMEEAMGESGQPPGGAGGSGAGEAGSATGSSGGGNGTGEVAGGGAPGGSPGGPYGSAGAGTGSGSGGGRPLTPAEQVAILDGQLDKGTAVFDTMILEEQAEQRKAARESAQTNVPAGEATTASAGGYGGSGPAGGGGGYSTGGGMGGIGGGTREVPQNTAKYPPPKDIPSGNDDDVVARQLREAAMREPDPAVREKLWDEYRKYKGISK
jgi:hypothetical protein